ncbi:MAG: L,D-transpeptidase family protein [Pseudomonadota bacterium]
MTRIILTARFVATLGLASLGGASTLAAEQSPSSEARQSAEQIAQEADNAIRAIDPTTGEASPITDPSLLPAYGSAQATSAVDLPQLPPADGAVADPQARQSPAAAPRTPAVRTISQPVAQPLATAPAATPAAAASPFILNSILAIPEGPFRYGDWYWDESKAPEMGTLIVTVDLDARVISAFRDGHEIGTAVALLGTKKHPTPLGTFPILTKEKDNISEKYNNAPMPWTLRLTWSGIAIHGSPVINGYASHGCIGVPDEFAEKLFAVAKRGDKVVITRGAMITVGDRLS